MLQRIANELRLNYIEYDLQLRFSMAKVRQFV